MAKRWRNWKKNTCPVLNFRLGGIITIIIIQNFSTRMIRNISVGIDVGSSMTRVVVGEFSKGEKNPKIVGVGENATLGLRHGYVVNGTLAAASIKNAVAMAEKTSGIKIKRGFVSLSGATLRGEISS